MDIGYSLVVRISQWPLPPVVRSILGVRVGSWWEWIGIHDALPSSTHTEKNTLALHIRYGHVTRPGKYTMQGNTWGKAYREGPGRHVPRVGKYAMRWNTRGIADGVGLGPHVRRVGKYRMQGSTRGMAYRVGPGLQVARVRKYMHDVGKNTRHDI